MRGGDQLSGTSQLHTAGTPHLSWAALQGDDWSIHRGGGEQSNTSIRIGERAMLKVIRKLEEGVHPELEVSRHLTGDAGFTATPATLGWFELSGVPGFGMATLSVLQAFVPNQGDGWSWVLERLCADSDEALTEVTAWLRRLGQRTAEMHLAFARKTRDPGFSPEPAGSADRQALIKAAQTMAYRALDGLVAAQHRLDAPTLELAAALLARRDGSLAQLSEGMADATTYSLTRHHGDYHLGQVLVSDGDAVIVDFEGEPLRAR
jgi:trehalose synthase-fused probable maltokinase